MREFLCDLAAIFVRTDLVDQYLDPRFVDIIAATVAVVNAQAGFDIAQQILGPHERIDLGRDHRGPAHAAADKDATAQNAVLLDQFDADIVEAHRSTVLRAGNHRNFELARQVAEFGMKGRPLAQQFGPRTRIGNFVGGSACILIGRNVADAVTTGLDSVHLDLCQLGQQIGAFLQLDPVILNILTRGEMTVTTVIFARDMRQHVHLAAVQRAIGYSDTEHISMELQIKPIHQAQRLELVFGHLARQPPLYLIAKFFDASIDDGLVKGVIFIHRSIPFALSLSKGFSFYSRSEKKSASTSSARTGVGSLSYHITHSPAVGSAGFNVRSGRTVGPSARTRSLMCAGRGPSGVGTASII